MQHYKVVAPFVTIRSGVIGLSAAQAKDRAHLLKQVDDGLYEVLSPTQFKYGEQFWYDGETNKALLQHIQPIGQAIEPEEDEDGSEGEGTGNEGSGEQEGEGGTTTPPVTNPPNANRRNRGR